MSVSTSIEFRNANDPKFLAAKNGTPEEIEEWEDEFGPIEDRPGAEVKSPRGVCAVDETNDEYGGWIIDLSLVPKETTHIIVSRG